MSTADISLLIYSKLRKLVKEKPLLANNYDPNAPNNKLYVNNIKLKKIINFSHKFNKKSGNIL